MLKQDQINEVYQLKNSGFSVFEISHRVKVSSPTIYKYLKDLDSNVLEKSLKIPPKLVKFQSYIKKRQKIGIKNVNKIFFELKDKGYKGSYLTLNRFIKLKSSNKKRSYKPVRFETKSGEQAQVDWGYLGKISLNDRTEKLYCFVYVLGWSRAIYLELTTRQNLQTLELCHIHAFEKLGMAKTILYDNMKTVVLFREKLPDGKTDPHFNPAFNDFAQYYGFQILACMPHRPQTKGKVESEVGYIKKNFMQGMNLKRNYSSLEDLNKKAQAWVSNVAHKRIHGTTREKPEVRWVRERDDLYFPKDFKPYTTSPFFTRNSTKDSLVLYKWNYYEVPGYPQKKLQLKETNKNGVSYLEIFHKFKLIQKYYLSTEKGVWVLNDKSLFINDRVNTPRELSIKNKRKTKRIEPVVKTRPLSYYDQFITKNG